MKIINSENLHFYIAYYLIFDKNKYDFFK